MSPADASDSGRDGDHPVEVRASGCVVWDEVAAGGRQVVVVHRPRYDDWSFPKGKLDPGETDEECAIREVREETGLEGELGHELDPVHYIDHKGRPKRVRYWLMKRDHGGFVPNDEVDELRWVDTDTAARLLTYPHDRALLHQAVARWGSSTG